MLTNTNRKNGAGFTLIELIVVIIIIGILSAIILFSISLYINKGKDASVRGNLAVLVPAGEKYYDMEGSYEGFCGNEIVLNAFSSLPKNASQECYPSSEAWAACAKEFAVSNTAYCVDSRGMKEEIDYSACTGSVAADYRCP